MNAQAGWYDDPQDSSQLRYWDGNNWTEHRAPRVPQIPTQPAPRQMPPSPGPTGGGSPWVSSSYGNPDNAPKKPFWRRTWVLVVGGAVVLLIIAGALGNSNDKPTAASDKTAIASSSTSPSPSAPAPSNQHPTHHHPATPTHASSSTATPKPAGLDADAGVANRVQVGSGFTLGDFRILPGWRIKNDGFGLGYTVDHMVVQNVTSGEHSFIVDIKLHQGAHRILADITCDSNPANPKDIVDVSCLPDGTAARYDYVTIENTF